MDKYKKQGKTVINKMEGYIICELTIFLNSGCKLQYFKTPNSRVLCFQGYFLSLVNLDHKVVHASNE